MAVAVAAKLPAKVGIKSNSFCTLAGSPANEAGAEPRQHACRVLQKLLPIAAAGWRPTSVVISKAEAVAKTPACFQRVDAALRPAWRRFKRL